MTGPRSTSRSTRDKLVVGVIKAPHGMRGEVRVDPRSDVPERFRVGAVLECEGLGPLTITSIRGGAAEPIVAFAGYRSRAEAEPLRGRPLTVSVDEARRAVKGKYLWADLVGLRAEAPDGAPIGEVSEIIRAGETDVLVLRREAGGDLLVPAIASVVREVDLAGGRVVVTPLEELE